MDAAVAVAPDNATPPLPPLRTLALDSVVQVRNLAARELDVRIVPWDRVVTTLNGVETFARGAFAGTDPDQVRLMGLEHEAHIGIGQDGHPVVTRHPVGKGLTLDDRDDGAYMTFRVAQTGRGDEVLALAADGIASGVSVEFQELPGGSPVEVRSGRRMKVHRRVHLTGASTTYKPTFDEAVVLAVRAKGDPPVAEETTTEATPAEAPAPAIQQIDPKALDVRFDAIDRALAAVQTPASVPDGDLKQMLERLDQLEEQARASFEIPARPDEQGHPDDFGRGDWMKLVLRSLAGETVAHSEMQARVAADLVTSDNLGVVPPTYTDEIIGIVDKDRPFLESTRRLPTPRTGMSLIAPKIVTRPTTGVQSNEKDELTSSTTSITSETFGTTTVGGYGDISLQLLRRSDPSYLELYLDLLAEAYAIDADDQAVDTLLAEGDINVGGSIDPATGPAFGTAWANAAAVSRRLKPDTIWMSSAAVAAFIDVKLVTEASGANQPLYSNLAANFSAAAAPGGLISGLRPVHVPALDDENADVIVGPARGFGWAEDGTYTLQVDVPAKAGRDVGLVGMLWFAPLYPGAFTWYWMTSS